MRHLLFVLFAFLSLLTIKASDNYRVSFSVMRNEQNDDKEKFTERHKLPARLFMTAYVENVSLFIQNYPIGSKLIFRNQYGENIMEGIFYESELRLIIPKGAEEIDVYTSCYIYHGFWR